MTALDRTDLVWRLMNSNALGGSYGPGERRSLTGTEANNVADIVFGPVSAGRGVVSSSRETPKENP